ncbi:MAG: isoprenylcysteine carboxylmethyltransferase family protein [Nitrospirae bacterium]|nr:isoprenylcysteine carboxylmethyltransferase family protein [Nitrospirota bacterium]MBI5696476.1 isoprenylcysteine carboxylmethyltransferase family protein [Nitrospirota bacterium]
MKETFSFFEKKRRALTAIFLVLALLFAVFTRHSWAECSTVDMIFDWGGALLIVAGAAGRMWATLYIGGRKNAELVRGGPYSICRNPLYLFSFIAGIGACMSLGNVVLLGIYAPVFAWYYPRVIKSEEKRLEGIFGDEFRRYRETTPAFFPKLTGLSLGGTTGVAPGIFMKNLLDASVFLLVIPVSYLIARLQEGGVIQVLWRIP